MFVSVLVDRPLKQSFTYSVPEGMQVSVGMRVIVPFGRQELVGYVIETLDRFSAGFKVVPVKRLVDKEPVFGAEEIKLASWMSRFYLCSQGEALALMIPGGKRESVVPSMSMEADDRLSVVKDLTEEQENAIASIASGREGMYYLYGVTGSGKSEVFLRSAESVIARGKQVIYLVPEITLTFQLARMVQKRFADRVAILHSALTDSQRLSEWQRIRSGQVDLVIGARSAVFAPVPDLGLIIIDEEHETSYKADQTPRYHARQIAQWRCREQRATLVMGSATPSMEAWKLAQEGKLKLLELPRRVAGGSLPKIRIVDMKGIGSIISPDLEEAMKETLGRKKQIVLFLNRRGFSYSLHCKTCGWEMTCPNCSVSLTYHKSRGEMVCHYCGYRTAAVHVCPQCHSMDVGYTGFGTEMVESEVRQLFPTARVARVDADVSSADRHQNKVRQIISSFGKGDIDILLGTQMVAKGLNFPGVELVGIVLADSGLHIPDFRAEERTFALLTQVSGRAGRYNDQGRVLIQTFHPENAAIVYAASGDLKGFYDYELQAREMTGFPPYSRLVNLVLRGKKEGEVVGACGELEGILRSCMPAGGGVEIMVNGECELERTKTYFRHHILLRSTHPGALQATVAGALARYKPSHGIYVEVDIDPMQML